MAGFVPITAATTTVRLWSTLLPFRSESGIRYDNNNNNKIIVVEYEMWKVEKTHRVTFDTNGSQIGVGSSVAIFTLAPRDQWRIDVAFVSSVFSIGLIVIV